MNRIGVRIFAFKYTNAKVHTWDKYNYAMTGETQEIHMAFILC
jgi:hypothetical protein